MAKSVQTVMGLVKPEELGRTLTHEHFSLDFEKFYTEPPTNWKSILDKKISLSNVGIIKQYPYGNKDNIAFNGTETHSSVLKEMYLYKQFGGGAIVENTTHGLQRNVCLMKEISKATGVHIIAGTGYYVSTVQPESVLRLTEEEMYNVMLKEMSSGCTDQPDIKCGVIGEVGSNWPLHEFEKRAIAATALVQKQLGCPVTFHPGRHPDAPFEIIRLYLEAGGNIEKAVMSHLDRTLLKEDELLSFSDLGCYCQFDLFGTECLIYQLHPSTDMPSDNERLNKVLQLLANNKEDKILLSHDIHTKHRLMEFGGHGFSHIINNVLPKLSIKGVSQEIIDKISIINPQVWLACPWEKH